MQVDDPISPELALVCSDLRAAAIVELNEASAIPEPSVLVAAHRSRDSDRNLVGRFLLYSVWQTFVGALFGLGLVAAVTAIVVTASFLLH
jgi:hypothetical protein